MKMISLALVLVFYSSWTEAQGLFPLQKGNIWQYNSTDIINPMPLESRIIGDTLLSNGKQYSILTGIIFGSNFLRQEGPIVYAYDRADSAEYILLNFSARPNDTLSHHANGQRTVVAGGRILIPEDPIAHWIFYELAGAGQASYEFYSWTIEDSVGVTSLIVEPGNSWNLSGALVNGKSIGTITGINGRINIVPAKPFLKQNYPNPFNPSTTIEFRIPRASYTTLTLFDVLGREICVLLSRELESGDHIQIWDATNYPSGVYFYTLQSGDFKETRKLLLQK